MEVIDVNSDEVRIAHSILLDLLKEFHKFCLKHNLKYYIIGGTLLGAVRHKGFIPWDVDADVAMPRSDYERFLILVEKDFPSEYFVQNIRTDKMFYTPKTKILVKGTRKYNAKRYAVSSRNGLNLDIFPLDVVPKGYIKRKIQRWKIKTLRKITSFKVVEHYEPKTIWEKFKKFIIRSFQLLSKPIPQRKIVDCMTKTMTKYNNIDSGFLCSMASHYDYNKQVMDKSIYGEGRLIEFEDTKLIAPDRTIDYLTQIYGDYLKIPSKEKQEAMYKNLRLDLDDNMKLKYCESFGCLKECSENEKGIESN